MRGKRVTRAVLGTRPLIWAMTGQTRCLSKKARRFLDDVERGEATAYVSAVTLLEVADADAFRRIELEADFPVFAKRLRQSGRYQVIDVSFDIAMRAASLGHHAEREDELVAATAIELGVPWLTPLRHVQLDTLW